MGILIDLLNLIFYLPFLKVTEEDIGKNIRHLKNHQWFQNYLDDEEFRELIIYDKDVRLAIGKFNINKVKRTSNHNKYQKKIRKMLLKKSNKIG